MMKLSRLAPLLALFALACSTEQTASGVCQSDADCGGDACNLATGQCQTRASRAPGRYTLAWDGRDDDGRLVPRGAYRVRVDINREKGPPSGRERHTVATLELTCVAAWLDRPQAPRI